MRLRGKSRRETGDLAAGTPGTEIAAAYPPPLMPPAGPPSAGPPPAAPLFTGPPPANPAFAGPPPAGPPPGYLGQPEPGYPGQAEPGYLGQPGPGYLGQPGPGGFGPPVFPPAGPAPGRRRRRWVVAGIALVIVAGLAGGLVAWAPWRVPPVLRPAGLYAGSATPDSASFTWSKPATGPLPDRYLILHDGKVIGSVPGTVTAYRATGLHYGSSYEYQVAAVRGGVRSPGSQFVLVTTATPPVSEARLVGSSYVTVKILSSVNMTGPKHGSYNEPWTISPVCPAGPCAVRLSGVMNGHHFKLTLTRAGGVYTGTGTGNSIVPCGTGSSAIPVTNTLTLRITLTGAQMDGQFWEAGSWRGSLLVTAPYVASSTAYCNSFRMNTSLSGVTSAANG